MKKLSWRLSKLPTPSELTELVNTKIITQEEAREILLSEVDSRDEQSLKDEIKFLRELVERLSSKGTRIVEVIKEIRPSYQPYPWYQPYWQWCSGAITSTDGGVTYYNGSNTTSANNALNLASNVIGSLNQQATSNFSSIKTF